MALRASYRKLQKTLIRLLSGWDYHLAFSLIQSLKTSKKHLLDLVLIVAKDLKKVCLLGLVKQTGRLVIVVQLMRRIFNWQDISY
ncbi:hypothetical protein D3C71_1958260 [compost metagenome]